MRTETFRRIEMKLSRFGTFGARVPEFIGGNLTMYVAALSAVVLFAFPLPGMASTSFWIEQIVIDPVSTNVIYATTYSNGFFKSTDGGLRWKAINKGLKGKYAHGFAIDPRTPTIVYAASGYPQYSLYRSTNAGANWVPIPKEGTKFWKEMVMNPSVDPVNTSTLYAVCGLYGDFTLYKSIDSGASWRRTGQAAYNVAVDPIRSSTLYVTDHGSLYKSTDGGDTWAQIGGWSLPHDIWDIVIDPKATSTVYGLFEDNGIWKSANAGKTWARTAFPEKEVDCMAISPRTPNIVYAAGQKDLYKSTNRGASWTKLCDAYPNAIAVSPTTPHTVYAGFSCVSWSTDGGVCWTQKDNPDGMSAYCWFCHDCGQIPDQH